MILPIVVTALIQTAACVLCVGLGYQMGFREGEQIEREKHIEDDSPTLTRTGRRTYPSRLCRTAEFSWRSAALRTTAAIIAVRQSG